MFHLIPHIKSAYQIRSYVRMDIKRGMYLNLNIGKIIAINYSLETHHFESLFRVAHAKNTTVNCL